MRIKLLRKNNIKIIILAILLLIIIISIIVGVTKSKGSNKLKGIDKDTNYIINDDVTLILKILINIHLEN